MSAAADSGTGVSVALVPGPLRAGAGAVRDGRSGARLVFEGVVRGLEGGRPLRALRYEAYEPMTSAELRRLAAAVHAEHGLHALLVRHSTGEVPVGAMSFQLTAAGAHRGEVFAATAAFIDRMKRDVPLWKVPVFT